MSEDQAPYKRIRLAHSSARNKAQQQEAWEARAIRLAQAALETAGEASNHCEPIPDPLSMFDEDSIKAYELIISAEAHLMQAINHLVKLQQKTKEAK